MEDRNVIEMVQCINCSELRVPGTKCSCGYYDASDAELCKKCGEYKFQGSVCRSLKCKETGS